MSNNVVKRLKEVVEHYEACMLEASKSKRIDADTRLRIKDIKKETLNEMITLIKRLY